MEDKDKILDAIIVLSIALVGLLTAYITFGILKSETSGQYHTYQVGGAIGGALLSWTSLGALYLKFRKAGDEPRELKKRAEEIQQKLQGRIEELQQKLLRGSPHPLGFEVEISEQQKIVLARPEKWQTRGGVLFDFELTEMLPTDNYPARFTCSFVPITKEYDELGMDNFYSIFEENIKKNELNYYPRSEFMFIGGESQSTKCIKVIAGQYMRLEFYKNAYGGKNRLETFQISEKEYLEKASPSSDAKPPVKHNDEAADQDCRTNGRSAESKGFAKIVHMFVACYRKDLKSVYFFEFMDDENDFVKSSEIFNQVLLSTRFLN